MSAQKKEICVIKQKSSKEVVDLSFFKTRKVHKKENIFCKDVFHTHIKKGNGVSLAKEIQKTNHPP